jgi:hypothetical protein
MRWAWINLLAGFGNEKMKKAAAAASRQQAGSAAAARLSRVKAAAGSSALMSLAISRHAERSSSGARSKDSCARSSKLWLRLLHYWWM